MKQRAAGPVNVLCKNNVKRYVAQAGGYRMNSGLKDVANETFRKNLKEFLRVIYVLTDYKKKVEISTDIVEEAYTYMNQRPMLEGCVLGTFTKVPKKNKKV